MTTDHLTLEVEDYSSRRREDRPAPVREDAVGDPIPALVLFTVVVGAFMALAVYLSQLAGAC